MVAKPCPQIMNNLTFKLTAKITAASTITTTVLKIEVPNGNLNK